jgi:hypothetical protein
VTVHLFRLDENKCCCIHRSQPGDCYFVHESDIREWTAPSRFVGFLDCSSYCGTDLKLDEVGKLLEGRIEESDLLEGIENPFQGIRFEVHLNCFLPEQEHPSAHTVNLEFGEVRLMVSRVDDDDFEEHELFTDETEDYHGVTLPHLLEHLKGWNPDD